MAGVISSQRRQGESLVWNLRVSTSKDLHQAESGSPSSSLECEFGVSFVIGFLFLSMICLNSLASWGLGFCIIPSLAFSLYRDFWVGVLACLTCSLCLRRLGWMHPELIVRIFWGWGMSWGFVPWVGRHMVFLGYCLRAVFCLLARMVFLIY